LGVALGNAVTLNFLKPVGTPDLTIPQAMSGSLVAMIEALHLAAIDLQTALGYLDDKPEHRGTIQTALDNYRVPVDKWLRLGMVDEGSRVSSLAGLKLEVKRMDLELDF
jgi:hypothetical protein